MLRSVTGEEWPAGVWGRQPPRERSSRANVVRTGFFPWKKPWPVAGVLH